jgi:hypothetical protein
LVHHQIPSKERNGTKVICEWMLVVYSDSAPSEYQVKYRSKQFTCDRELIEDDPHPARPVELTSLEIYKEIEDLVMHDRHLKISVIA